MVICFEKRGLYTDEEEEKAWRGYLAAVLLIGVVLAGCRRTGGDAEFSEIQAAWQVTTSDINRNRSGCIGRNRESKQKAGKSR